MSRIGWPSLPSTICLLARTRSSRHNYGTCPCRCRRYRAPVAPPSSRRCIGEVAISGTVDITGADAPIGVFDSGLGGLTVVRALRARLPHESLIYVGDTARVPYGPKSPDTVRQYATQIAQWLSGEGVKAIVVACNTATAHALTHLQSVMTVPVIGVVAPGARAAVSATRGGPIGVIGTTGTINSGAYEQAIRAIAPAMVVVGRACPLFVPLVEEGWMDHPATRLIVREYLAPLADSHIDTLVLGCTHYPLLAPVIAEAVGPGVRLIDSAEETALEIHRVLASARLLNRAPAEPQVRFVASDAADRFLALGRRFLDDTMAHVEHVSFP
ncbi:MAG: glutamate racemase [Gemmatimonadaceae bacterium]|nr:glutamate racemase [Gemmatimonadaceae bacterium]